MIKQSIRMRLKSTSKGNGPSTRCDLEKNSEERRSIKELDRVNVRYAFNSTIARLGKGKRSAAACVERD
ncbi:LOW QUALITY PROTEIN: hypothetical protein V1477_020627, partial [Vespula maculifrons]